MSDWNAETAEWYAKKYGNYPTNILGIDELTLSENATIVDVGCGTGSALRHATTKIQGGKFIGIDPVPRMIEIAIEETKKHKAKARIEFRVGSAENLPVNDDTADYVLSFDSIDHWLDIDKGLEEIKRIMQSNGMFVIVKDKSVPGAKQSIENLITKLLSTGFNLIKKQEISHEEVNFFLLLTEIGKHL